MKRILCLPLAGLVAALLLLTTASGCSPIKVEGRQDHYIHHDDQHIYLHFGRRTRRVQ